MTVASAALVLKVGSGTIMSGSLELMSATASLYPETRILVMSVTSVGITNPDGILLRTSFHADANAVHQASGSTGE